MLWSDKHRGDKLRGIKVWVADPIPAVSLTVLANAPP
jgi:hypothetical protein